MEMEYKIIAAQQAAEILTVLRSYGFSTSMIRRLKRHPGGIKLDGIPKTVRDRVAVGQVLTLTLPSTPSPATVPTPMVLQIVYEDDCLLVVNKPAGMSVHPSAGHQGHTLANGVTYYMGTGFVFRPIIRLDRLTTGLVLIAKNPVVAADLCRQIRKGHIKKTYYAVTDGIPDPPSGRITLPIAREPGSVIKRRVHPDGQEAITDYEIVSTKDEKALVKLHPLTGRTHQLRVHMAAIGCPLCNDFLYGTEQAGKHLYLQCTALVFAHPLTGERIKIEIQCNCPEM